MDRRGLADGLAAANLSVTSTNTCRSAQNPCDHRSTAPLCHRRHHPGPSHLPHTPPSPEHTDPALQVTPTPGWLLQHFKAVSMQRPPHFACPVGQSAWSKKAKESRTPTSTRVAANKHTLLSWLMVAVCAHTYHCLKACGVHHAA